MNKGIHMDLMLYTIILIVGAAVMLTAAVMRAIAIFGISRETESSVSAYLRATRPGIDALSHIQARHLAAQMRSLIGYIVVYMAYDRWKDYMEALRDNGKTFLARTRDKEEVALATSS